MTPADVVLLLLALLLAGMTLLFAWLWHRQPAATSFDAHAETACDLTTRES